jgi:hypothetical protein
MTSLDITNCEIGTITSRSDHSCAFRVITPELLASQAGELMRWHGRACRVAIFPHEGAPENVVKVATERSGKTPSQRLYNTLFVLWKQDGEKGIFEEFYNRSMEGFINSVKEQLNP